MNEENQVNQDVVLSDQPNLDQSGSGLPNSDQPNLDQSGSGLPNSDQPNLDQSGSGLPNLDQPNSDQFDLDQPVSDQPSVNGEIWNPALIDDDKLIKAFETHNKAMSDQGGLFWFFLIVVYAVFLVGAFYLFSNVFDSSKIAEIKDISPDTLLFWIIVIQKVGFLAIVLSLGIPLIKLFTSMISLMLESKDRQSIRFMNIVRFVYVLKYKGIVNKDHSYEQILGKNEKKVESSVVEELSSLLSKIEKTGVIKIIKQLAKAIKG